MKYLFFDYDGTLAFNGVICDKNLECLARAQNTGHKIFLNTGRSKGCMPKYGLDAFNWDGMICGGSYMEYEGKILFEEHIDPSILRKAQKYSLDHNCSLSLEGVDDVYDRRMTDQETWAEVTRDFDAKYRINHCTLGTPLRAEDRHIFAEAQVCEVPDYFEITPKGYTKSTGLKYLEDNLGVAHEDIIVFGDSLNDIEMLKYAQTAVIMNHAPESLEQYATLRTESQDGEGVAEALIKLELA